MPRSRLTAAADSPTLGRVKVLADQNGTRLVAGGILYAVRAKQPARTPDPWLALAAAPWMSSSFDTAGPRRRRVGLLGYGGGTVAGLLHAASPDVEILGAEPDPHVRRLALMMSAKKLPGRIVPLRAEDFLKSSRRFDALLDDIFIQDDGRLRRPGTCAGIPPAARDRLAEEGIYAVNLRSPGGEAERRTVASVRRSFRFAGVIYSRDYAHKVVVASNVRLERGAFRRALKRLLGEAGGRGEIDGSRFRFYSLLPRTTGRTTFRPSRRTMTST